MADAWGGRLRLHRVAMPPAVVRAAATGDLSSCARSDWLPKLLLQSISTLGVAWHARVARSIWTPTVRPIDRCKNSRSNFSRIWGRILVVSLAAPQFGYRNGEIINSNGPGLLKIYYVFLITEK